MSSHLSHPKYRPDIDGLRALAVLSVVCFHAFPNLISGGFIGVDVFFVISGYLISTIIFENLDKDTFSLVEFYVRRIKRIFPALTLVLTTCFIFGWFTLLADEYRQLGKHIAGGSAFISNFILWNEAGYFDHTAESKPLLHLWSLGIEEQFYLVWPLILWIAYKKKLNLLTIGIGIGLLSFILNLQEIGINRIATFYSPQTRFWELMTGSILSWVTLYKPSFVTITASKLDSLLAVVIYRERDLTSGSVLKNVFSFLGIFFIVYGILRINKELHFPGTWALVPVLGAVFIILAGPKAWCNRVLLSNRLAVWFGLISFPLYLWHWPLLSFARILGGGEISTNIRLALLLSSLLLAWLTYFFIEKKLRKHSDLSVSRVFSFTRDRFITAILAIIMFALGLTGLLFFHFNGIHQRSFVAAYELKASQLEWHDSNNDDCKNSTHLDLYFCMLYGNPNNIQYAIIGDSTSNALAPGFGKLLASKDVGVINLGSGTCPPILGLIPTADWGGDNSETGTKCISNTRKIYSYVRNNKLITTVILSLLADNHIGRWAGGNLDKLTDPEKFQIAEKELRESIVDLQSAGKTVFLTYDDPHLKFDTDRCIKDKDYEINVCPNAASKLFEYPYIGMLDEYFRENPVVTVLNHRTVLPRDKMNLFDGSGALLLRDSHHLSYRGSDLVARSFISQMKVKAGKN